MCFVVKAPVEDLRNAAPELSAYRNLTVFASELDYWKHCWIEGFPCTARIPLKTMETLWKLNKWSENKTFHASKSSIFANFGNLEKKKGKILENSESVKSRRFSLIW